MSTNNYDAIVIGGGVMGMSTAYYLAEDGAKVLLLEQSTMGHLLGSSHGKSRIIRYAHTSPTYLPLAMDVYPRWDEITRLTGIETYKSNGLLWLGNLSGTAIRAEVLRNFGVEHLVLDNKQVKKRFPHLNYDEKWHAIYDPKGGTAFADKCLQALKVLFLKNNGVLHENEAVTKITPKSETLIEVHTTKTTYFTKKLAVTAGAWMRLVFPELPVELNPSLVGVNFWNVQPNKEKHFNPDNDSPVLIISDNSEELFMIPGVDYPDKVKCGIHLGVPIDPSKKRMEVPSWMHSIPGVHLKQHIPFVDSSHPAIRDTCLYTMTPDHNFIIDRHPKYPNIVIGGGFSGTGFKFGPTVGHLLKRMLNNDKITDFDLSPFRLNAERNKCKSGKL